MQFQIKAVDATDPGTDAAIVFTRGDSKSPSFAKVDDSHNHILSDLLKKNELKTCESADITLPSSKNRSSTYYLCLLEDDGATLTTAIFKKSMAKLARKLVTKKHKDLSIFVDDLALDELDQKLSAYNIGEIIAVELNRAIYQYTSSFGNKKNDAPRLQKVLISTANTAPTSMKKGFEAGAAIANGINLARELGNLPGNYCTPTKLGQFAKDIGENNKLLMVKTLGRKAIEKLNMGSFLSVTNGSDEEPCFIVMEYKGKSSGKPHVLVGKGITFDSGGISLKPGASMDEMKFDMCGAAGVLGTMRALVDMKAKVHVVALIAAAENMPSGRATKPGDVVTSMSGNTIEVLNTDAEGRLVLCDALTYAERYKPKSVIDVATLTGACVIALGRHASGLYSNNQSLADKLIESGNSSGDRAWQMPLWDDYQEQLKSNFADVANIGGREAGSVTAACFLSRFTKNYPWAHIDIAGTAWNSGSNKGATGRPVELLTHYLLNNT